MRQVYLRGIACGRQIADRAKNRIKCSKMVTILEDFFLIVKL